MWPPYLIYYLFSMYFSYNSWLFVVFIRILVYAHLKAHIRMKSHTMQISKYIWINWIFGYVDEQMCRHAKNRYFGSKNTICVLFLSFFSPFGPVLTLFNTQTQFYMIRIWYLDLEKKKTCLWICASNAYIIFGFMENISAYAVFQNAYPNETA